MEKTNISKALSTTYLSIITILTLKLICSYLPTFLVTRLSIALEFLYIYILYVWMTCSTSNPIQLPFSLYFNHIKTIFTPPSEKGYNMPIQGRIAMFCQYTTILIFLPMWTIFWFIDVGWKIWLGPLVVSIVL